MKKLLLTVLSFWALSPLAMAQEDAPKYLRLIPLGNLPTWSETLKRNIRQGDPLPPGSVPPDPACFVSGGEVVPLVLKLKTFTPLLKLEPATKGLTLKNGAAPESPNWLQQSKPAAPLSLGVLLPDSAKQLWHQPRMLMLQDDAGSFPAGNMRFVNASSKVMYIQIGGNRGLRFGIAVGKDSIKPLKMGANSIKVWYKDGNGGEQVIWDNAIRVLTNQRVQSFFYNSNAGKGKPAVEFRNFPEVLPRLPKAPQ